MNNEESTNNGENKRCFIKQKQKTSIKKQNNSVLISVRMSLDFKKLIDFFFRGIILSEYIRFCLEMTVNNHPAMNQIFEEFLQKKNYVIKEN